MASSNELKQWDGAVIVALGSNLSGEYDSPRALLEAAQRAMTRAGLTVARVSRFWRSKAWPDPADPPYVNAICLVETDLPPAALLGLLHRIEQDFGRDRRVANAPRTLDLDLIAYGRIVTEAPALPHPRAHERKFVMGPLAQIAPEWTHPVLGRTAAALAGTASVGRDAAPI